MIRKKLFVIGIFFILTGFVAFPSQASGPDTLIAPEKDTTLHPGRLPAVLSAEGALCFGSLGGLYFAWYKNYPQSSFHLFNDNNEWMHIDKIGHATTAYYISMIGYNSYCWAGLSSQKATIYGSLRSMAYLLNIEILDGFSSQWGFSLGDFMVKDYNGQTYWLSGNIASFLPKTTRFPKWINVAFGYGAEGMLGASSNPDSLNHQALPHYDRYRQFYLSMDVDLTRIPHPLKDTESLVYNIQFPQDPLSCR